MSRYVVITSIFPPTEAVRLWAAMPSCKLICVGDRKTPPGWAVDGAEFIPFAPKAGELAVALPADHYCRKMLGYARAIKAGAEVIMDTDDDNRPKPDWSLPPFEGDYSTATGSEFVNVYNHYTSWNAEPLWPRGFPLRHAARRSKSSVVNAFSRVAVWQGLVDGDPDVDAIYRMTRPGLVEFERGDPLVLGAGSVCPFNSQNTAFRREAFPLLYLPISVTFRYTDILRGLVAQPILWKAGYRLGFTEATAIQDRNQHDLMRDFQSEIPCYLNAEKVHRIVGGATSGEHTITQNLMAAYRALLIEGIVSPPELGMLRRWLAEIS